MPKILIVEKLGNLKGAVLAPGVAPGAELYKKAGFKVATDFGLHHTYDFAPAAGVSYQVELYGKTKGRAGQENKYDFPPPMDETLFFGSCVLVCRDMRAAGAVVDLTAADWEKIYEHLFGGFEDLGSEDSDDDSEEAALEAEERRLRQDPKTQFTKEGYVKDDFIVDDDDDDELLEDDDDSDSGSDSEVSLDEDDDSEETEPEPVPAPKKRGGAAGGTSGGAAGARKRGGAAAGAGAEVVAPLAVVTRSRAPATKRPPVAKTGAGAKPKRGGGTGTGVEEPALSSEPLAELEEEAYFA